ncbi:Methionyl-tRNA formyltransferase [Polystyrenella longa]|uniref:Methionyl-tRNA formyltransferase n=1 Tax=Polystyrenella longa TaxID=2528007 RepID=A0A518CQL1_9PLAN|nr:methionyl-tRNA formyltransferase [Polystyrenella longa]QDU81517.1 Methionyl-tRNA formyltransferase [Polystyrenella longa]
MKLVMMGTGVFALPTLRTLIESNHEVVGLFTQPDRHGRGHHQHINPMKALAEEHQIPVFQPIKANAPESIQDLQSLDADLCVVAAYGQILSQELLDTPKQGAINLHASLLPKYRGAAPIQWAVKKGEQETGVTIFQIEPKLDAGPVWGVVSTPIGTNETYGELQDRLALMGAELCLEVLGRIESGTYTPVVQDHNQLTLAPRLAKEDGEIDWTSPAAAINSHVRAVQPWPKPTTVLELQKRKPLNVQILQTKPKQEFDSEFDLEATSSAIPGEIIQVTKHELCVRTGNNENLLIEKIQPAGKKLMEIDEFLRGYQPKPGDRFVNRN